MSETAQETAQVTELFDNAKKVLEETEGRYGHESLVLAEKLEEYALLLRAHKGSMMEAFSAESRAKAIRSNFNRDKIYEDVANGLRNRSLRDRKSTEPNEAVICLTASLLCGALGFFIGGMIGFSCGVIFASGSWLKCIQWRIQKLWVAGGILTGGVTDLVFLFMHFKRAWMATLLQTVFMLILGVQIMSIPAPTKVNPNDTPPPATLDELTGKFINQNSLPPE